jgi:Asp/Glu/hydantoin racemase
MTHRIFLVHPYFPSMAPIQLAFRKLWPEARTFNLLDDSLYAEMDDLGTITDEIVRRTELLLSYCQSAGADAIAFTGSTFGPAVDRARRSIKVPVIKTDEAMAEIAIEHGQRICVLGTAKRAIPVIMGGIQEAAARAGRTIDLQSHWVAGAQAALAEGRQGEHDRLIVDAATGLVDCDVLLIGQISMATAIDKIATVPGRTVLDSPQACVARTRALLNSRPPR